MTIANVMNKSVISVDVSITVNDAVKMMEDTKVGAGIVMEYNTPVRIITDRDFAIKVASHADPITTRY
jgi:predicted transcriptional regulator